MRTTMNTAALAILATVSAGHAAEAQVSFGELLKAIRLSGSENMMVHTLSAPRLPMQAYAARNQLLANMGLVGTPGEIASRSLSFSPVMTHDNNINGGFASDSFTFAGYKFNVGEEYKAVEGLVLGGSVSGKLRMSMGEGTALSLQAGASVGYAPEHDMYKTGVNASACVNHIVDFSTFTHACVDLSHRKFELGETTIYTARVGGSKIFDSRFGVHEAKGELQFRKIDAGSDYEQGIASFSLTSAIPGPWVVSAGFQIGQEVEGINVMRERAFASLGFELFDRPTSISISRQENRGGMWLGEDLTKSITSVSVSHQVNKKLSVSAYVAEIDSSAEFYDDTQFGLDIALRF